MDTEQKQWATQLRAVPIIFSLALQTSDDQALRHRPGQGEWSAIEVLGHMIDKMGHWAQRVERIVHEENPALPRYDQDAEVREHDYQHASLAELQKRLEQRCEHFAVLVELLPFAALQRTGVHSERGSLTLRQCVEIPLGSVPGHLEQLRAAQKQERV